MRTAWSTSGTCAACRCSEIVENEYNLNISRYVSTAEPEEEIDLAAVHAELVRIDQELNQATARHNEFLKELGLPLLP
jgi:type I restriction enzyme M protein